MLCVANLSRSAQAVEIDLSAWQGRVPRELLGRTDFPPVGGHPYIVTLAPYGFFWFQLVEREGANVEDRRITPEYVTLVVTGGWDSVIRGRSGYALESEVLPSYLAARRWFPERDVSLIGARVRSAIPILSGNSGIALVFVDTEIRGKKGQYALPLTITWTRLNHAETNPSALAAVRRGPREGMLCDVSTDSRFIGAVLDNLRVAQTIEGHGDCRLEFKPTSRLADEEPVPVDNVRGVDTEQSNTSVLVGTNYVIKLFRRRDVGSRPRDRGWSIPNRQDRVRQYPAVIGCRRTDRRRHEERCSSSPPLRRKPRRRVDSHERLSRPLRGRATIAHSRR